MSFVRHNIPQGHLDSQGHLDLPTFSCCIIIGIKLVSLLHMKVVCGGYILSFMKYLLAIANLKVMVFV